ncbi:transposase [Alteromonas halophila]|uniref:Transposase n=1 Tax=Alteromonas halophila TaxID=516698 RepID=A0A918N121_9ALTE|nr:transposase [Alteromonas halophila]GGW95966.1 hypothetical protein GCM10007391_32700 [Alteromonas halophila]
MSKKHPSDIKNKAVEQVVESNRNISTVANEFSIPTSTLYGWVKHAKALETQSKEKYIQRKLEENLNKALDDKEVLVRALCILSSVRIVEKK